MKKSKKLWRLAALSVAALMALSACSSAPKEASKSTESSGTSETASGEEKGSVQPSGEFPISDETVELNCYISNLPANETLENNYAVQTIEEKLNVKLNFEIAASPEATTLALNSGTYGDIMFHTFSGLDIMNYGVSQKILVPITEYVEKYCKNLWDEMDRDPKFRAGTFANDGEIYAVPDIRGAWHGICNPKTWMNTDWLKAVGKEMPQTTEEFYDVLKTFKENDPNSNGVNDEIPMSGAFSGWDSQPEIYLMNAFVYTEPDNFLFVNKDKVEFTADTDAFKKGITYIKKLVDEGLIDVAAFTQDGAQLQQLGQNPDTVILGSFTSANVGAVIDLNDAERSPQYSAVLPLKGPDGVRYTLYDDPSYVQNYPFTVTDKCKNIPAALRVADFMLSEEACMLMNGGREGEDWRYAEEGEVGRKGTPAKYYIFPKEVDPSAIVDYKWDFWPNSTGREDYRASWVVSSMDEMDPRNLEMRLENARIAYEPYIPEQTMPPFLLEKDDADTLSQLKVQITDYVKQSMTRFITGDLSIESDWDAYITSLNTMGLQQYVDLNQKGFDTFAQKRDS